MRDELNKNRKETVRKFARHSFAYVEPICQECWDRGRDDPLGVASGVNTPANEKINSMTDEIIEHHDEATHHWVSEIRQALVDIFHEERQHACDNSEYPVENDLECFYCYEEKKRDRDNDEIPMRVKDADETTLDPEEWR